jgi:hypothetical protein
MPNGEGFERPAMYAPRPGGPLPPRGHRRAIAVLGAVVVVLVVAGAVVPAVLGGSKPTKPSRSARAELTAALDSTATHKTADITLSGTLAAGSTTIHLSGSGQVDFADHDAQLQLGFTAGGHRATVQERAVDGTVYAKIPQVSALLHGKTWISIPASSAGAHGILSTADIQAAGNPSGIVSLLKQAGGTVESLGASTQDGVPVEGYEAVLNRTAIESELGKADLPSWAQQAASNVDFNGLDVTVYVESDGLLHSVRVTMSASAAGTDVNLDEIVGFTTYGTAVTVQAPPATSVVTAQQFVQSQSASAPASA